MVPPSENSNIEAKVDKDEISRHSMYAIYADQLTPLAPPLAVSRHIMAYGSPIRRIWVRSPAPPGESSRFGLPSSHPSDASPAEPLPAASWFDLALLLYPFPPGRVTAVVRDERGSTAWAAELGLKEKWNAR